MRSAASTMFLAPSARWVVTVCLWSTSALAADPPPLASAAQPPPMKVVQERWGLHVPLGAVRELSKNTATTFGPRFRAVRDLHEPARSTENSP